jgi:hypothetical protein
MKTMTLDEFQAACRAQADSHESLVVMCPMCATPQTAADLIAAGAGASFDEVGRYLGFSCFGRWLDAPSPRKKPDGKPCNWTLGGLFALHTLEVVTPDGVHHPHFELASKEVAEAYHAAKKGGAA